ncbi:TonB-dependent receptor, partial [Steroidobacter sp.]|uniref:TonB-dependent receptor n=1 Tax=Steroidobacter sp. TaxID=1978227 RepID=UPI001A53CE67
MRTPIMLLSSLTVSTVLAAQTNAIQVAQAGASKVSAEAVVQLNIPAGDLLDALKALAKQTGIDLVYLPKQLAGRQTQGIKGELTVQDALRRLLEGTALRADTDVDSGAILISEPEPAARSIVEDASGLLDEVLVSRRRPFTDGNMDIVRTSDDAQAYQIIGKQDIEKSGAADVESFLKKHLSMNTAAQLGTQSSISTGGATTINLRGIGANQTLILINGRRTANTASFGAADQPDVRSIPLGAVERIEVLPVSSSAIYGGSAIGGVVNVVLKRDLEGGQVGVSYRTPFDVHAPMRTVDASYGTSLEDGRTHLMAAIRYSDSKSPRSRDRPELFERGLQTVLRNNPALLTSPTSPYRGGTTPNIGSADGSELVLKPEYGGMGLGSNITHIPLGVSGVTAPLDLGAGLLANAGSYNFSPVSAVGSFQGLGLNSPIHGEPETKSIIASARRRMTDNVELFAEFYHSTYRLATDWAAYNLPVTVSAASPVNPFRQN